MFEGNPSTMLTSVSKITDLPGDTLIWPGRILGFIMSLYFCSPAKEKPMLLNIRLIGGSCGNHLCTTSLPQAMRNQMLLLVKNPKEYYYACVV